MLCRKSSQEDWAAYCVDLPISDWTMSIRRSIFSVSKRAYSATSGASFAAEIEGPKYLTVNFCTPHESIFVKKQIEKVTVPGEGGDVGMTFWHSPVICQLKPGLLTFSYIDVSLPFTNSQIVQSDIRIWRRCFDRYATGFFLAWLLYIMNGNLPSCCKSTLQTTTRWIIDVYCFSKDTEQ